MVPRHFIAARNLNTVREYTQSKRIINQSTLPWYFKKTHFSNIQRPAFH